MTASLESLEALANIVIFEVSGIYLASDPERLKKINDLLLNYELFSAKRIIDELHPDRDRSTVKKIQKIVRDILEGNKFNVRCPRLYELVVKYRRLHIELRKVVDRKIYNSEKARLILREYLNNLVNLIISLGNEFENYKKCDLIPSAEENEELRLKIKEFLVTFGNFLLDTYEVLSYKHQYLKFWKKNLKGVRDNLTSFIFSQNLSLQRSIEFYNSLIREINKANSELSEYVAQNRNKILNHAINIKEYFEGNYDIEAETDRSYLEACKVFKMTSTNFVASILGMQDVITGINESSEAITNEKISEVMEYYSKFDKYIKALILQMRDTAINIKKCRADLWKDPAVKIVE